jgi:hypothetical protein
VTPRDPTPQKKQSPEKRPYEAPEVKASYEKEELEALIKPEGQGASGGCGCGSVL